MKIIRNIEEVERPIPQAVVTIGNFDGVHLGHREIFRKVVAKARQVGGAAVVLTFCPHPLKLVAPERAPRLINTYAEKERLIEASCIDVLLQIPFTAEVAAMSAEAFVRDWLVRRIGVKHLIVGYDYAFGRGREGNVEYLRQQGEKYGFSVEELAPVACNGIIYSSTRIRELLLGGKVEEAMALLGRNFTLEGQVVAGAGRGKGLGFPTANLMTDKDLVPKAGVYAVKVRYKDRLYDGVVNIGYNPTFGAGDMSIEVHLFDFHGRLYGESLRIYFVARLRDEKRFPSSAALVDAIADDIARARNILAQAKLVVYREYLASPGPEAEVR